MATPEGKPTLLHLSNSQSQLILWLLEELEIPFDVKLFEREKGRAPESLKETHPLGKSPQLITASGRVVIERLAITAYLLDTYDTAGKFAVSGKDEAHDKLREMELSGFATASVSLTTITALMLYYLRVMSPFFIRPIVSAVSSMMHLGFLDRELDAQFRFLESLLGDQEFFLSDGNPTRVDFFMLFFVQSVEQTGIVKLDTYPKVKAWHDRCTARPAWKRALEKGNGYSLKQ